MKTHPCLPLLAFLAALGAAPGGYARETDVKYVISISVDGLGSSYVQSLIDHDQAPNFRRFQSEGAWTNNARNDCDKSVTLPNHTDMLTGRGVKGPAGHNWTTNVEPGPNQTLHANKGFYLFSVFDVAHDYGLRTALYAGKKKFILYARSYDGDHGHGNGHGTNKIDAFVCDGDSAGLTRKFVAAMSAQPFHYTFFHFAEPDASGHPHGWGSPEYMAAVKTIDKCLGSMFRLIETNPALRGRTCILLTADHGGKGHDHSDLAEPLDYTIPFYVWGPGVAAGKDLYALNRASRRDPGIERPSFAAPLQPIRNADGANLALMLLGLPRVPGSTINARQDLSVQSAAAAPAKKTLPAAAGARLLLPTPAGCVRREMTCKQALQTAS